MSTPDHRLIVALDVGNALDGLGLAERLGPQVGFYKIGLGMLTGGGLALANELKAEHGKRIFLDMKLFDIGATVEAAVRGLAQFELDFLTVQGDPHVVSAAKEGAGDKMKILAVTVLTSLDRADLDNNLIQQGEVADIVLQRAERYAYLSRAHDRHKRHPQAESNNLHQIRIKRDDQLERLTECRCKFLHNFPLQRSKCKILQQKSSSGWGSDTGRKSKHHGGKGMNSSSEINADSLLHLRIKDINDIIVIGSS